MNFSSAQWIAWLSATVVAAATMVSAAYTQFETKDNAKDTKSELIQRLDRMEEKLDTILERQK